MTGLEQAVRYIDEFLQLVIEKDGIPGMALAITDREKLVRVSSYGFAELASRTSVTSGTLFEIGSLGKPFTSIALLQLKDEGKLDLQKPVAEYLPWFQVQSEYSPILVHHLMNHTAGLVRGTDIAPHGLYESWALRHTRASAPPGEYFSYSNIGYKTLGFLLEELMGKSLGEIIQTRVLEPLEMRQTYPVTTLETRKITAAGYCGAYDDRPEHTSHGVTPALWSEYGTGDGCEVSTVEDMAKYLRMLLNRGQGPRTRLISEDSFKLMTLDGIWTGGDYYGYGLATYPVDGRTYIGHGGGNAGYRSAIVVDLDAGLGVVMLLNRMGETDPIVEMAQYVLTIVRSAAGDEDIPPVPEALKPDDIRNVEEYTGTFYSGEREIQFLAKNGKLVLATGGREIILEKRAPDSFYTPDTEFDMFCFEFKREDGSVVEMFHGSDWYVNKAYTGPRAFDYPQEWLAYTGHYRTRNPELSNFRIVMRKGLLILIIPWGNSETLIPIEEGVFRIGENVYSPETLRFASVVDGHAFRADYSGCPYYRSFTP